MKILLIDDHHALIREGLRGVLNKLGDGATVLEAEDARQAMLLIETHADLDIILLDLSLPDQHGFEVLAKVRGRYPAIPIVILSAFDDRHNVVKALKLGALGFIPKSAGLGIMKSALQLVLSGGTYIPPHIFSGDGLMASRPARKQGPGDPAPMLPLKGGLTRQQMRVLALIMQGKSNKQIGNELNLAGARGDGAPPRS